MKRVIAAVLTVSFLLSAAVLSGCRRIPKDWYKATLDYYSEGMNTGWANEDPDNKVDVSADLKVLDAARTYGYLLVDLDGDGVDELLVGFNDGSNTTKFTDVIVWRRGVGAYKVLGGSGGYYVYLCAGNVIKEESWYGSATESTYMTWDSKKGVFTVIDGEGKYLPKKWNLTGF